MAAVTTTEQKALLLSPQRLLTDYILLEFLQIKKSKQGVHYTNHSVTDAALKTYYPCPLYIELLFDLFSCPYDGRLSKVC